MRSIYGPLIFLLLFITQVWYGELSEPGKKHSVAVKKYPSAWGEEEMNMFRRETGVLFMAAMRCHNVCKVYGTTFKDGKLCIVMKLYKESMQSMMKRYPSGKLPLVSKPSADVLCTARRTCTR